MLTVANSAAASWMGTHTDAVLVCLLRFVYMFGLHLLAECSAVCELPRCSPHHWLHMRHHMRAESALVLSAGLDGPHAVLAEVAKFQELEQQTSGAEQGPRMMHFNLVLDRLDGHHTFSVRASPQGPYSIMPVGFGL